METTLSGLGFRWVLTWDCSPGLGAVRYRPMKFLDPQSVTTLNF